MSERSGADRMRRLRLRLRHLLSSVRGRLAGLLWRFAFLDIRTPGRLLIAPPDIRTADPTVAADIYGGYFVFDGKFMNTHGRSPFEIAAPSVGWAQALADFGWLRHLRAADTSLARANAKALVGDWISQCGRPRGTPDWTPEVAARRLLAWLSQSPIILDGADGFFYRAFMVSLGRHAVFLRRAIFTGLKGEPRLFAAIALTQLALCADGVGALRRQAIRILIEEIAAQILPDGGHVSRDPKRPVELILYFLPLRQAFVAAGEPVPPSLLTAVDRMIPMVRAFRHGDGALALFNGMGVTRPEVLATILAHDDAHGRALSNALYSGYQRLDAGDAVVILDVGLPPPACFSRRAHAGTLAFEFSVGAQQLVVNCGAPDAGSAAARDAARTTAAHSVLVLADHSSSRFFPRGRMDGLLYAGPTAVPARRSDDADWLTVEASHDGYVSRFDMVHRRRLSLALSGDRLDGEDRILPQTPRQTLGRRRDRRAYDFAVRFHLHPSLRSRMIRDDSAALIAFPTGEVWVFEAGGLPIGLEESIYFAAADGARRTDQLVVLGHSQETPAVAWSFSRWRAPNSG